MKNLHLICNAHLDPVWMWDWDEGVAEALATFYSAVELSEEYDYIFCHNEVLLYEYIEKYDPILFNRIRELVSKGKWHIMGGWYLQPDCMIPCGESFIRQITLGREYFSERFPGAPEPTVAVNFDSFGHTRGLVQILKKCGYTGYIVCRPMPQLLPSDSPLFAWRGYDGSSIPVFRVNDDMMYCTGLGHAVPDILHKVNAIKDEDVYLALWGVGNHGGGASRKDLSEILKLIEDKRQECNIFHSTPEAYFLECKPKASIEDSLPCFIKSYTSIHNLKAKHAELENRLYETEKICAMAEMSSGYEYSLSAFHEAERALCFMEFHDVLSGTCTERGEKSTICRVDYALTLLREEFMKAFHSLAKDYIRAKPDENPFIICSFQPYEYETVVETEILIPKAIVSDKEQYSVELYQNGERIPSQIIKEESNINYDRRKRIAYRCKMDPLGVSRVDLVYKTVKKYNKEEDESGDIVFRDKEKSLRIGRKSGLLESYCVGGKEYLTGGAFAPVLFIDNADPWGWDISEVGKNYTSYTAAKKTKGPFEGLESVRVTECGEVLTQVESLFCARKSYIRIVYKIYRNLPYIDVSVFVLWNEKNRGLKIKIPVANSQEYFGQTAFGKELYKKDGRENPAQRFVGVKCEEKCFTVYNDCGVNGVSMKGEDLYLTLLNGSAYCAHPIEDRPLIDDSRVIPFIEQGKHDFHFRVGVNSIDECERIAQQFNNPPYSVNMYPHGDGNVKKSQIVFYDNDIVLSSIKRLKKGGYIFRFFNSSNVEKQAKLQIGNNIFPIELGAYSFETFSYKEGIFQKETRSDLF